MACTKNGSSCCKEHKKIYDRAYHSRRKNDPDLLRRAADGHEGA